MERPAEDRVFLALTRPSVFMGLPMEAIMPIIMICMILWTLLHNPLYPAGVFAALYFPARLIVHYDFYAFRLWGLYLQTTYISRNKAFWKGGSYSPVRLSDQKRSGVKRPGFGND